MSKRKNNFAMKPYLLLLDRKIDLFQNKKKIQMKLTHLNISLEIFCKNVCSQMFLSFLLLLFFLLFLLFNPFYGYLVSVSSIGGTFGKKKHKSINIMIRSASLRALDWLNFRSSRLNASYSRYDASVLASI